ncbi:RDD family protein [Microbacterium sp.]|uniref:RDD family protein n=1 Tax=Microbacterium sp. TaxID=51671 RepID=UPI003F72313C
MIWEVDEQKPVIEGLDAEGRPDPAYAAALGLVRAPFGRRALALTVDAAIWVVLSLPFWIGAVPLILKLATGSISPYGFLNHPDFVLAVVTAAVSTVLGLVLLIVQLVLHGRKGKTIGKAVAGIRSVNVKTLARPGVGAVVVRFAIVVAAGIVPVLGPALILASPTFDPDGRGRGLHDKAAGFWLVDVRKGLDPYDEKRMRIARKTVKAEPVAARVALPSLATSADPAAQPEYRPASRGSAGVLGVARTHELRDRPVAEQAPPPSAAPESPTPVVDAPRPPVAMAPPAPAPASVPAAARLALRFDSGESIPVDGPVLLGRNPEDPGNPGARAVALADDSRSLSKTHALVTPVAGGLEVADKHSTNGSALIRGDVENRIDPAAPVLAVDGDRIRLGDRIAAVVRV